MWRAIQANPGGKESKGLEEIRKTYDPTFGQTSQELGMLYNERDALKKMEHAALIQYDERKIATK